MPELLEKDDQKNAILNMGPSCIFEKKKFILKLGI
jgi:hypothetical protein